MAIRTIHKFAVVLAVSLFFLVNPVQVFGNGSGVYRINAVINPDKLALAAEADILFKNVGKFPLDRFVVYYSGEAMAGQERLSMRLSDGQPLELVPADEHDFNSSYRFLVKLPQVVKPGDSISIKASFNQVWFYTPDEEFDLRGDWYPLIDPGYVTAYSFFLTLTAPVGKLYSSSGAVLERTPVKGKSKLKMEVIGFESNPVGNFYLHALPVDKWHTIETRADDVQVRVFWEKEHWREWMKLIAEDACDAIRFYKKTFGFYPAKSLCIMPGSTGAIGGGPVASGVVAIHDLAQLGDIAVPFAKWIVSHEIGHQYFMEYVMNTPGYNNQWLVIGLGLYMDRHYSEYRNLLEVSKHHDYGEYLGAAEKGFNTTVYTCSGVKTEPGLDRNNAVIHAKGYAIIRMLEELIGPAVFREVVDRCLRDFACRAMSSEDFRAVCEEYAKMDLQWFFDDWLRTPKTLSYSLLDTKTVKEGDSYVTRVTLSNNGGIRMPIPVQVIFEDGSQQTKNACRELDFPVLTFTSESPVKEVTVNPGNVYAMLKRPPREKPEAAELRTFAEYRRALKDKPLVKKIRFAMGNYGPEDCKNVASYFELALKLDVMDIGAWHLLGLALYDGERYQEAITAFEKMAQYGKGEKGAAYVWLGQLYDLLGERKKAVFYYNKALLTGVPRYQYGQYRIYMSPAYVEQLIKSPFERHEQDKAE